MNFETLFEKFDLFADMTDAVAKMRQLVLQLAVQGKLVPQDPKDEPTSACPENEALFDLPTSWQWKPLGTLGTCRTGKTPPTSDPTNYGAGFPFIGPGQITLSGDITPSEKTITQTGLLNSTEANAEDILMVCIGGSIGKVAICRETLGFNQQINSIRLEHDLPTYVYIALTSSYFQEQLYARASGSATPIINKGKWEQIPIPMPPTAEQKRIVAKVDELMALCDRLEVQQQKRETQQAVLARASLLRLTEAPTPANLNFVFYKSYDITPADLRKSILTLAVQGKLVSQDPNDESASTYPENEAPFDLPASWQWKPLGTLGTCRTGKTPPTSDPTNYGAGFPFIGPGQITLSGSFTPPEKTITQTGLSNSTEANVHDILMVCIGGSIGKAAICRETLGFNQQINSIRLERDLPAFVYLALTSAYFQEQVLVRASGSATPIINKGKWEQIPIPIPSLPEQRRIVAKVDELMALVDKLEAQLAASRATGEKLLAALVTELTAGKESHAAA